MTDAELETLLERLEAELTQDVQRELDATGAEFARALGRSTELTAAVFSVSKIRDMWRRRVPRVMAALRRIVRRGADVTANGLDARRPTTDHLEEALTTYFDATEALLNDIGDRLAEEALEQLAEGVNAGESTDQLKARLRGVFGRRGAQLGPTRAERIAMTESTRAFNAGVQAAAETEDRPERPIVKQWLTRRDDKVRPAHAAANGQTKPVGEAFDVGGFPMRYPGDPEAPASLTVACRCVMVATVATRQQANEGTASMGDVDGVNDFQSRMPPKLKQYWIAGPGAAKIRWGTPGDFDRCVRALRDKFPEDTEGLCANLHHDALGKWPGQEASAHTGAMVALVPSAVDAERLAAYASEPVDQLHLTLAYLGEAADWDDAARAEVLNAMAHASEWMSPVYAKAFGIAQWNPDGESPSWVWNVGDDPEGPTAQRLKDVHLEVTYALEDRHGESPDMPAQFTPWSPHVCAHYGDEMPDGMPDGCGPIVFDRLRIGFGGEYTDFQLIDGPETEPTDTAEAAQYVPTVTTWSTPDSAGIAFENRQTGDGRVFTPGALYWEGNGPWPLMANENFDSHDDAALAGAIASMYRQGERIGADGLLYLTQESGAEAAMLLAQEAPLGVSVDLDDVSLEFVDMGGDGPTAIGEPYRAHLIRASVLPLEDGGYRISAETASRMTAGASGVVLEAQRMTFFVGPDGTVPRAAFEIEDADPQRPDLVAAAGDPGAGGTVMDEKRSGDYLMRITRARVRGATLVTVPAFADARIVLDDPTPFTGVAAATAAETHGVTGETPGHGGGDVTAATWAGKTATSGATPSGTDYDRVLRHVRSSKGPVGPARVAQFLKIPIMAVQRILARASSRGEVVRLTRGLYTDSTTSAKADHVMTDDMLASGRLVASVTGSVDLPVAPRDTAWDGTAAATRVFAWADGDTDKIAQAFAYRDDNADPATKRAYKLGYADVVDGRLTIIPRGVFAAQAAADGARGGADIPADQLGAVKDKLAAVRAHVDEETGAGAMDDMQASAWAALKDLPPMPAAWFREPTVEELPPGGPGVNYANGRIFGWVAQANVPHAGYAKRVVVNDLGRIDTSHFLRQRFTLDDGSIVKAGAFTMNAGHHRDGAECETSACQFDDTRTVAGIVTVGMNERGLWFSGAAAPWMSEWDRSVFMATQPSYHMKQGPGGRWELRAVLSVPVPGHSSPLLASAVVERSQLALTAAATMAEVEEAVSVEKARQEAAQAVIPAQIGIDYDRLADSLVAAMARAEQRRADETSELEALLAEARTMIVETAETEGLDAPGDNKGA